jgi:HipA-like C-terminal domain
MGSLTTLPCLACNHGSNLVLEGKSESHWKLESVRRIALAVETCNGDRHLKNCWLIYPDEGGTPALAPVYDVLSTTRITADCVALSRGGVRGAVGSSLEILRPARGCPRQRFVKPW